MFKVKYTKEQKEQAFTLFRNGVDFKKIEKVTGVKEASIKANATTEDRRIRKFAKDI